MSLGISYAGFRSGFPFPIRKRTDEDFGLHSEYPIGFTLLQLTEFFWRAKFLKVQFDLTAEVVEDFTIIASSSGLDYDAIKKEFLNSALPDRTVSPNIDDWREVENESQLVTGFTDAAAISTGYLGSCVFIDDFFFSDSLSEPIVGSWTSADPASGDVVFFEFIFVVYFRDVISVTVDGVTLYYPRMILRVILAADLLVIPTAAVIDTFSTQTGGPTIPLTICGATAQVPVYRGAPTPSANAVSASGSITIEPTEYFTYGGKFNATTGARA
jgi:hypothetical protein